MNPYKYSVSLRFRHPKIDPAIISKNIGVKPNRSWKVGNARTTPKGSELPGTWDSTYWVGRLHSAKDVYSKKMTLETFLDNALNDLESKYNFIRNLLRTGGTAELFIGLFSRRDYGFEIDRGIINRLNKIGISLGICVYLEEQK